MKILIVSGYFYPEITPRAFRTTQLAIELSKQNHEVFICIPYSNYDLKEFEIEYNLNIIILKVKDEPKILNKKNIFISKIKFLMSLLFQYPKIKYIDSIYRTLNCLVGFDLLISIAAPHSIHGVLVKL
jgi:hypothetical protein